MRRPALTRARGAELQEVRSCKRCGCTDAQACAGGCFWIGQALCSACGPPAQIFKPLKARRAKRQEAP